ncbi:phage tail assembly chaperone [Camelimonas abortus]|uniref:Phage tail assembly chaperone n=1 Tax=Camelimonas abortus TaxID=1017184 RepID=A0ABV7LFV5_9HYPH
MVFGLGTLRLAPETFWAMTPREIAAAMRAFRPAAAGDGAPSREWLRAMARRFPDGDTPHGR